MCLSSKLSTLEHVPPLLILLKCMFNFLPTCKIMHLRPRSHCKSQNIYMLMLFQFLLYSLKICVFPHFKYYLFFASHLWPIQRHHQLNYSPACVDVCYTQIDEAHELQLVTMVTHTRKSEAHLFMWRPHTFENTSFN
jgi:hypothetical protein